MSKEIDNIFVDVRNAFRLLTRYQKRILNIVCYIREQTPFTDMWGKKDWYSDAIGNRRNSPDSEYAKLNVFKEMWGLDFLYGHFFEYYFGCEKRGRYNIEMSLFQVSDDGFFISGAEDKHMTDVSSYADASSSHSYIIFNVSVYTTKYSHLWLSDSEDDDDWKGFLTRFLSSAKDTIVTQSGNAHTILKKYEMQRFTSQASTDEVIADFARLVKDQTGVLIFKETFYKK